MRNVLVLWAKWMLWNCIFQYLSKNTSLHTIGTSSKLEDWFLEFSVGEDYLKSAEEIFSVSRFDYVINCIGTIRPDTSSVNDSTKSLIVNAHLPKTLQKFSFKYWFKLIHFSTDCVFDWRRWSYSEDDIPNELWIYGLSKYLGEIDDGKNLTIRTSIIGIELWNNSRNLLNWFLSNKEGSQVSWYSNVFWNGLTTLTLAKIVEKIIIENLDISGLVQFWWENISKYELLGLFNEIFAKNITIVEDRTIQSNKTMILSKEQEMFRSIVLPLREQITELKTFYRL